MARAGEHMITFYFSEVFFPEKRGHKGRESWSPGRRKDSQAWASEFYSLFHAKDTKGESSRAQDPLLRHRSKKPLQNPATAVSLSDSPAPNIPQVQSEGLTQAQGTPRAVHRRAPGQAGSLSSRLPSETCSPRRQHRVCSETRAASGRPGAASGDQ